MFTNYVVNKHLEVLKLEFKGGIWVSKLDLYVEKSLRGNQVFKTRYQNRNTKNTRTETRRNNQQIKRNTKEQQIRNKYIKNK